MRQQYYAQHVKTIAKPGKRDELIQQLKQVIKSTGLLKDNSGCIYYLISTTEEPDAVCVSELWTSKEAKDAVEKNPESAKVMKELIPLVASMADRTVMTVVGGIGIKE